MRRLIEHGRDGTIFFHREVNGPLYFCLIQVAGEGVMEVDGGENGWDYIAGAFPVNSDAEVLYLLPLLLQNQDDVDGAAATEAHQYYFHGPGTQVLTAAVGRAVEMDFYAGRPQGLKMKGIVYAL